MDDDNLLPLLEFINRSERLDAEPPETSAVVPNPAEPEIILPDDVPGARPRRPARPRPPAVVSYGRVDRPLVSSGLFRMWTPATRGDEQAALEALLLHRTPTRSKRRGATSHEDDLSSFQLETLGYATHIEYQGRRLLLSSAYTLGAEEILVLVAACGLAGMLHHNNDRYEDQRKRASGRLPKRQISVELIVLPDGEKVLRLKASLRALVAECGLANTGPCRTRVLVSLLRLSGVTCADLGPVERGVPTGKARAPGFETGPRLLGARVGQPPEAMVHLDLSVRLTTAALQRTVLEGDAVFVDLHEARAVSDGARILLLRLSERVRPGLTGTSVRIDEMVEWIYGPQVAEANRTKAEAAAVSMRRTRTKAAAAKVAQLPGWAAEQPRTQPRTADTPEIVVFRHLARDEVEVRRKALVDGRLPAIPPVLQTRARCSPHRQQAGEGKPE